MSDIKKLREEYKDLTGGNPFNGWSEEKLLEKMTEFKEENNIVEVTVPHLPRVAAVKDIKEEDSVRAHTTRHEENQKIIRNKIYKQLFKIEMIFIKGAPMAIIDNEYIPWEEAELIGLKKVKAEVEQLIEEKTVVLNN